MAGLMQKLDMRQGQSLVMTPQLQQAIKLLQLSNIELAEFVEGELERNPLLERDESESSTESLRQEGEGEPRELELSAPSADANDSIDADSDVIHGDDSKSDLSGVDSTSSTGDALGAGNWSPTGSGGGSASWNHERRSRPRINGLVKLRTARRGATTTHGSWRSGRSHRA